MPTHHAAQRIMASQPELIDAGGPPRVRHAEICRCGSRVANVDESSSRAADIDPSRFRQASFTAVALVIQDCAAAPAGACCHQFAGSGNSTRRTAPRRKLRPGARRARRAARGHRRGDLVSRSSTRGNHLAAGRPDSNTSLRRPRGRRYRTSSDPKNDLSAKFASVKLPSLPICAPPFARAGHASQVAV